MKECENMAKFVFGKAKSSKEKLYKKDLKSLLSLGASKPEADGFAYLNAVNDPFVIGGLLHPNDNKGIFYRLDPDKQESYSGANRELAYQTAGGTVRFSTDAKEISLRITIHHGAFGMHHFCDRGVYGVDAYVGTGSDRRYVGKMMQTFADNHDVNTGTLELPDGVKEVCVNLPLYAGVEKLEIGFPKGARVGAPTNRTNGAVAFYGSSITQGGCVSRPANSYCSIICRALDSDCVNYGFSGSAMGELSVADHIASRDLACFVMDYDYNAPSHEHLESTHEPFFKHIRERNPELPVVFVTHPFYAEKTEFDQKRIDIVKKTYENALAAGDKNVYFVDSTEFFTPEMRDLYAVDYLHPNDLGQFCMAETIFPVVKKALGLK